MTTLSNNPNSANHKYSYTDNSLNESLTSFSDLPKANVTGATQNTVQMRADQSLWDSGANQYVSIQNTTAGTVNAPKVGQ
jgi:hypothetical protein